MSSLLLKYLAFLGPNRPPASIKLESGLNVICGASETGKSFIVESIDFMLGGGTPPKDIPEKAGYDCVRLLVESAGWPPLGLERSIEGGHFSAYESALYDGEPSTERKVLRDRHSGARDDTLSHVLLERVGLISKKLRRNKAGDTRSLSFRDLARLSVVNEEEIQRRGSPLLSGQVVQATPEYAAFKLLITGTDDSALVSLREVPGRSESVSGKLELLDQLIEELQGEIDEDSLDEAELRDQLERLEKSIEDQNTALNEVQAVHDNLLQQRASVAREIQRRRARLLENQELTGRFKLLDEHYHTDLKRLEAIHESGSFFVHLDRDVCPLCGANPGDQHLDAECDGNTEMVVLAASAEMDKIRRLERELSETVATLNDEVEQINSELPSLWEQYQGIDEQLTEIAKPTVSTERASYNQLILERAEVNTSLEKFKRLKRLVCQKDDLEIQEEEGGEATESRTSIPKITLDSFSQTVERILTDWHYPNANRVFFDESGKDFQIAGKDRGSTGQGLRAITHAAVSIALLEFCLEHDLPHPGFLILDSPLLAYWKPEGEEDNLSGTDLKEKFYDYILGLRSDSQVIIVENEHPPDFVSGRGNVIVFTKNPNLGRYGFFPHRNGA